METGTEVLEVDDQPFEERGSWTLWMTVWRMMTLGWYRWWNSLHVTGEISTRATSDWPEQGPAGPSGQREYGFGVINICKNRDIGNGWVRDGRDVPMRDGEREGHQQADAKDECFLSATCAGVGYDWNRIIRPETGTEPEFRFRLNGTGMDFKNSGSG